MFGKVYITRQGYDPQQGKHIKDPYLGDIPSIGACRPDVRKQIVTGGQIFVISGKVPSLPQFVMGGFEVAEKISMREAFQKFPQQRLRKREDGQLEGNVILTESGEQHPLDDHRGFERRLDNYIVGRNPIALTTEKEILFGREQTLEALQEILKKKGKTPHQLVGQLGANLTQEQAADLQAWLRRIKQQAA